MKKELRHFEGLSRLILDEKGAMIRFCTDKVSENQATRAIQRGMNKKRGCIPSASLPIAIRAVNKCTKK